MDGDAGPRSEPLSVDEREQLRRAHQRLRNTSNALEALVATEPLRGRWPPEPAPPAALAAAAGDLHDAYEALVLVHHRLVGLDRRGFGPASMPGPAAPGALGQEPLP